MGDFEIRRLSSFFKRIDFDLINADSCILTFQKENRLVIIRIYVNNLILANNQKQVMKWVKGQLFYKFNMKDLGEAKIIIGRQITRDLQAGMLNINQNVYV